MHHRVSPKWTSCGPHAAAAVRCELGEHDTNTSAREAVRCTVHWPSARSPQAGGPACRGASRSASSRARRPRLVSMFATPPCNVSVHPRAGCGRAPLAVRAALLPVPFRRAPAQRWCDGAGLGASLPARSARCSRRRYVAGIAARGARRSVTTCGLPIPVVGGLLSPPVLWAAWAVGAFKMWAGYSRTTYSDALPAKLALCALWCAQGALHATLHRQCCAPLARC